ncbi:hypothetical protein KQX54_018893 [Cotesia glomerata]|uniref:Uncharacterized protein n=1 Tax=Cotesia glomerata TaxID=32391 RepID=A0AAV7IC47_COTGL|nr:hypothetical protein KQX54_018893 [Cotesia glomerata]
MCIEVRISSPGGSCVCSPFSRILSLLFSVQPKLFCMQNEYMSRGFEEALAFTRVHDNDKPVNEMTRINLRIKLKDLKQENKRVTKHFPREFTLGCHVFSTTLQIQVKCNETLKDPSF